MEGTKRILVTGGAGFIGSEVVRLLHKKYQNYSLIVLDSMTYAASRKAIPEGVRLVEGDVCSADLVRHLLRSEEIDVVMHFAAESHVDRSFGNSLQFTKSNVVGTHTLLECALERFREGKLERFIHVSTDEVYGETGDRPTDETRYLRPTNPYAATKAAAEMLVGAYHTSFGLPVIVTRGNNVYGPGQYPEKLIPRCITRILDGLPPQIQGDGSHTRNYVYVEDVATAFDLILHHGTIGETYNIGVEESWSNLVVAETIRQTMNFAVPPTVFVEDRPFNDQRYNIDSSKLRALGWEPKVGWVDGLTATINWYAAHPDWWARDR